jgi:hypothetical protein
MVVTPPFLTYTLVVSSREIARIALLMAALRDLESRGSGSGKYLRYLSSLMKPATPFRFFPFRSCWRLFLALWVDQLLRWLSSLARFYRSNVETILSYSIIIVITNFTSRKRETGWSSRMQIVHQGSFRLDLRLHHSLSVVTSFPSLDS